MVLVVKLGNVDTVVIVVIVVTVVTILTVVTVLSTMDNGLHNSDFRITLVKSGFNTVRLAPR